MAMTLAALDYRMRQQTGALQRAWRMQRLFEGVTGDPVLIRRHDITSVVKTDKRNQKYYEWPVETIYPWNVSANAPGQDSSPDGFTAKMYIKRIYAIIEADRILRYTESDIGNSGNIILDRVERTRADILPNYAMQQFWMDGSGRRAIVAKVTNHTGFTRIHLLPLWAQNAAPGCFDATKYLEEGMWVDITTWDETSNGGAGGGAQVSGAQTLYIVRKNIGSVAYVNGTEDSAYIDVTPRLTDTGVVPIGVGANGAYVSMIDPTGAVDGEPQGCFRWIGDGYNANRGANAAFPAFGCRKYADMDRQDVQYRRATSYVYNRYQTNPFAQVTLGTTMMAQWLDEFYSRAPRGTKLDAFICHPRVRDAYWMSHAAQNTLYSGPGEVPSLGYRGPVFHDPHTGRTIPVLASPDVPRQTIWGFTWQTMLQGDVNKAEWTPGDNGGIFRDLTNITKSPTQRATWEHNGMFVQHNPATSTVCFFVNETPTFS